MGGTYLGLLGCGFLTGAAIRMVQINEPLSMLESGGIAVAVIAVGAWLLKREERQREADRKSFEKAIDRVSGELAEQLREVSEEMKQGRAAAVGEFNGKLDRIEGIFRQIVNERAGPPAGGAA